MKPWLLFLQSVGKRWHESVDSGVNIYCPKLHLKCRKSIGFIDTGVGREVLLFNTAVITIGRVATLAS